MSVLMEFSIFPTDRGASVSSEVSQVIALIRDSGLDYQLTPMGTIIEAATVSEALSVVEQAARLLDKTGCERVYSSIKLDIRQGEMGRMSGKIRSICSRIGDVATG